MSFERGDVLLLFYPDSNMRSGKTRPALVVQASRLNTGIPQIIVAMVTSKMIRAGHPSRITVPSGSQRSERMGLRSDSLVMTDNLTTVELAQVKRRIGRCDDMSDVDRALRHTLGLGDPR